MSIAIDSQKCIGCGKCRNVCPGSLIKLDSNSRAYIKYPKDCWGCTSCIKECPAYAISFYLGADIGGMGSLVHTEKNGDILSWIIDETLSSVSSERTSRVIDNEAAGSMERRKREGYF